MMGPLEIRIKNVGGVTPSWGRFDDAGLDLFAAVSAIIPANGRGVIPLGIQTEFPPQYVAIIKDRSSHALEGHYIHGGVIDASYRGEWKLIVENKSEKEWVISQGDKIAQVIFLPRFRLTINLTTVLSDSSRGSQGFGSTDSGRKNLH